MIRHPLPLVLAFSVASSVVAAPKITNMPIRGLQIGGTTTITIQGSDLLPNPILVTSIPIAKQKVLEKAAANNVRMEVTLDANVTPGMYNLRIASEKGISESVIIAVDTMPQIRLGSEIKSTPVAIHGTVSSSTIIKTPLSGKAGQEFLAEVEAVRLGGKLRPVLHLYDSRRRQIALAMPNPSLHGDTRLTAKLPVDGTYTLEIHDLQYAGTAPGHFRLKIGSFQYADMVFPPAVQRGKSASLKFIGNVPDGNVMEVSAGEGIQPAPWPAVSTASGTRPRVLISDFPELVETPDRNEPQQLSELPVAVSGRLDAAGQDDVYRVAVTEGAKLRFEVFADRIGSPIDSLLEIRNDKGGRLALNDDTTNTTDSRVDYTVAKGVETVDVSIKDQVRRSTKHCIYRLVISPIDEIPRPSFTLKVAADTHNVPQGSNTVFQIAAERKAYDGPITITVDNLPSGLTATAPDIDAGSNGTLMTITGATGKTAGIITKVRGTSVGINPSISSVAVFDKHLLGKIQPWMQNDIALALAPANQSPFRIEWSKPLAETQLTLGTTIKAPLKLNRPPNQIGPVRLSLVVGQPIPTVNNKPDANGAVRAAKATVDIPVDAKAKAAFDALASSEKAVSDAKKKAQATREEQARTVSAAEAPLKAATDKKMEATKLVVDIGAAVAAVEKIREQALKELKEAKAAPSDDTAARIKAATDNLAAVQITANNAANKLIAAKTSFATAEKVLLDLMAKAKAANTTATVAIAAIDTVVKDTEEKQLAAEQAFLAAEKNIQDEAEFEVIVPPNLTTTACDLALKAELRSVDNKIVLATVFTPVRRFTPLNPLGLKLSGEPQFTAKLDSKTGATVTLTGTIQRKEGFAGDVTVSIDGQPGGVTVPKVVVKPDNNDYTLELKFPPNFKTGKIETIKLFATGPPNPKTANIVVRTEIPISVTIQPAESPEEKK